jgi:Raf kinase inhibitor-like YbhB/YbcL family protein
MASMTRETKPSATPAGNTWITPEGVPNTEANTEAHTEANTEAWKGAPSRESTGAEPKSENVRLTRQGTAEQNAPLLTRERPPTGDAAASLRLIAPSFEDGTSMPDVHAATGSNLSPPLRWTGVPARARSLALLMEDPDAPDPKAPKRIFTHWIVVNLPPSTGSISAGASRGQLPGEAREGRNDQGTRGYTGPAPPIGRHRYFFRLYALDTLLPEPPAGFDRSSLLQAIRGHVLVETQTLGTYEKPSHPTS